MAKQTKKTATTDKEILKFQYIPLSKIFVDGDQPRKYFDEVALNELTDTIKQTGVLQPILVRPYTEGNYLLVCGERRYRASQKAGLSSIPATIRDLNEDEAFEIQIMENLQRKDVEPIEEAEAFQRLISKKMDIDSIALKVGKAAKYVAQRLHLNNLIDEYKAMLHKKQITLKFAYKIAMLGTQSQEEILKGSNYPNEGEPTESFQFYVSDHYFNRTEILLSKATWKLDDVFLYPEAGACGTCQYNSGCQTILFPDSEAKCLNTSCFLEKKRRAWRQHLEQLAAESVLFVTDAWYPGEEDKLKIKMAEDLGIDVIDLKNSKDYKVMDRPETINPFDDWADYNEDLVDIDREDYPEKWHTAMTIEYQKDVLTFDKDHEEFMLKVKEKNALKAYDILDNFEIVFLLKTNVETETDTSTNNTSAEVDKIKEKELRNEQLDRDKIYKSFLPILKEKFLSINDFKSLNTLEKRVAAFTLFQELGYGSRKAIAKKYELNDNDYGLNGTNYKTISYMSGQDLQELLETLIRHFIIAKLAKYESAEADWVRYQNDKAIYDLADNYIQSDLLDIQDQQYKKREQRKSGVEKRIKALQS